MTIHEFLGTGWGTGGGETGLRERVDAGVDLEGRRLLRDASPAVAEVLERHGFRA